MGVLKNVMIKNAEKLGDMAIVTAIIGEERKVVFRYFDDELKFSKEELEGLSEDGVADLFYKKNIEQLRS